MKHEKIKFKGYVIINNKYRFDNIVCNKFYEMVADFFVGTSPDKLSHLAIGTGLNTATVTDIALQTEVIRVPFTTTASVGSQIHVQVIVDGSTAIFNWKELGLFNAAVAGDMTNRVNIDYVHNAGELVTIDWYIEKV